MTGLVTGTLDATLSLRLRTTDGVEVGEVAATIDTGFTEFLLLPTELVEPLGLTVQDEATIGLGDGTSTRMDVVAMDVQWFGRWRTVKAYVADTDALVGVSLLEGCRLLIDFVPGGEVRVEPI